MCLLALALGRHARFPLVIAANRDEYFARATEPLQWWSPAPSAGGILSGRDLAAGGTWMGLTAEGRLALLTNVRATGQNDPAAPSRGRIVSDWLSSIDPIDRFWQRTAAQHHNGFNLIAADWRRGGCFRVSSTSAGPEPIEAGLYGLSNAGFDSPWPKVLALKARLAEALEDATATDALAARLFAALSDRSVAPDAALPSTGLPLEAERGLSSAFVDMPERGYGTRSSTLVIVERTEGPPGLDVAHVFERTFDESRAPTARVRRTRIEHWPLAEGSPAVAVTAHREPVIETALA